MTLLPPTDTTGTIPRGEKRCVACKESHPFWRCPVVRRKTPTERTKLAAQNKLCFFYLNEGHAFRQCPQPRKCTKQGCSSSHNILLHGSERMFPRKSSGAENKDNKGTADRSTKFSQKSTGSEGSGMSSVSDVKGLLQTEVELESPSCSEKVLVLCDSACSLSWISKRLADKLQVEGSPIKLTVHGINSQQLIDTETVELKLTPVLLVGSCSSFPVKHFVRKDLKIGNDFIDVNNLKAK